MSDISNSEDFFPIKLLDINLVVAGCIVPVPQSSILVVAMIDANPDDANYQFKKIFNFKATIELTPDTVDVRGKSVPALAVQEDGKRFIVGVSGTIKLRVRQTSPRWTHKLTVKPLDFSLNHDTARGLECLLLDTIFPQVTVREEIYRQCGRTYSAIKNLKDTDISVVPAHAHSAALQIMEKFGKKNDLKLWGNDASGLIAHLKKLSKTGDVVLDNDICFMLNRYLLENRSQFEKPDVK